MMTKKRGRPFGSNTTPKIQVSVILTLETYEALEAAAEKDGYKIAQLARILIERGLKSGNRNYY